MDKKPQIASAGRKSNIELLRILAMLMIVAHHFATHGGFEFGASASAIPVLWHSALSLGGYFGVDIFVLISGYFLIEDTRHVPKPEKLIRLWGQIFFYSAALFLVAFAIGKGDTSVKNIFGTLFPVTSSRWWFASTYFVLYLIHPFLNRLLLSLSERTYRGLLLLMLVMWSVIPTFTASSLQSNALLEFVMIYALAGYIRLFGLPLRFSGRRWLCLHIGFTALTYVLNVGFSLLDARYGFAPAHYVDFYGRNSIFTILRAVSFFMAFLTLDIKASPVINKLSAATFGVYLLHDSPVLRPFLWQDLFHVADFQNTAAIIPYSLAVTLLVYAGCTLIELLRKSCVEGLCMGLAVAYCKGSARKEASNKTTHAKTSALSGNAI